MAFLVIVPNHNPNPNWFKSIDHDLDIKKHDPMVFISRYGGMQYEHLVYKGHVHYILHILLTFLTLTDSKTLSRCALN